jgi:hypothetical protein
MPTIDELSPATASYDTDEILASQSGVTVKVTRAQILSGIQPALAIPSGTVLGRESSGIGSPETLTLGANLVLNGGTLSATTAYVVSALPAGTVPAIGDLVAMGQGGTNTAVPYGQFMSGLSGVASLDASKMLVTPTGGTTSQTLASFAATTLPESGGIMTGTLTLAADPAAALQAATKRYVDAQAVLALPAAGGTMTGVLTLAADPAAPRQAATKAYVDAQVETALPLAGGTMTGYLALSADPVASIEAATKNYVDSKVATALPIAGGILTGPLTLAADPISSLQAATKHYADSLSASGLPLTGGTLTGPLTLAADPTVPLQAATKHYVDTLSASELSLAGGTLTGPLLLSGNPSVALQAASKQYVDSQVATALPVAGGTLTGALTLATNPSTALQAATKQYVDAGTASALPVAGGTLTGALGGTSASFSSSVTGANIVATGTNYVQAGNLTGSNNVIRLTPAASGSTPTISLNGPDANRGLNINLLGSGVLGLPATSIYVGNNVWSGSTASSAFAVTAVPTGTTTATFPDVVEFLIDDSVNASGGIGSLTGFDIRHNYSGIEGGRTTLNVLQNQTAANVDTAGARTFYQAVQISSFFAYTQPGATPTAPLGTVLGMGIQVAAGFHGSPQDVLLVYGLEVDAGIQGTATSAGRAGIYITDYNSTSQGYWTDNALWFAGSTGSTLWRYGINFGDTQPWPIDNTYGTVIGANLGGSSYGAAQTAKAKWGIDFQNVIFPSDGNPYDGGFLRSNGFSVDGAGTINQGSCYHRWSSSGLAIDCKGAVGVGATIANPGSGYTAGTTAVTATAYGGVWVISVNSSGVPSAVYEQLVAPVYPSTATPANPVAVTPLNRAEQGTGLTLNIAWNTTASTLSLNPSGGVVVQGGAVARQGMASSTPATSGTIAITAGVSDYRILGSATLAKLTIELPPSPANGQMIRVSSQVAVTALTVLDSGGGTSDVQTPPTALPASGGFSAQWNTTASAWWCCVGA